MPSPELSWFHSLIQSNSSRSAFPSRPTAGSSDFGLAFFSDFVFTAPWKLATVLNEVWGYAVRLGGILFPASLAEYAEEHFHLKGEPKTSVFTHSHV